MVLQVTLPRYLEVNLSMRQPPVSTKLILLTAILMSIAILTSCTNTEAKTQPTTPTLENQLKEAQAQLKEAQAQLSTTQEQALLAGIQSSFLQQYPGAKVEQVVKPQEVRIIVSTDADYRHFYRWTDGIIEEIARVPLPKSTPTPSGK